MEKENEHPLNAFENHGVLRKRNRVMRKYRKFEFENPETPIIIETEPEIVHSMDIIIIRCVDGCISVRWEASEPN